MKTLNIKKIRQFDILLYEKKFLGKVLFFHCAWYAGRMWGMRINFESTARGPEFEEWKKGHIPKYVCRLKKPLDLAQRWAVMNECRKMKDRGYDYLGFIGHYFGYDNPLLMRCDELIELPLLKAGIKTLWPERRPRGYLKSPVFNVFEVMG